MKGMLQIELPMRRQSLKDYRKIKMCIIKTPLYFTKQKKRQTALFLFNYYKTHSFEWVSFGGSYWIRTSDFYPVKVTL